ncbi:hypothetical protein BOSEA31B_14560 [Hyphomicrobiales bacterium]|nr:hypothetical protein BOSEA31B_14560 [Hyphomicrobiales bacterium]CAH1701055.1 hypothetical protein BOSEA1005_20754 [Hyphomicrobiales bacterium]CAI0344114.1 hypothetical protein BO1005MUT1_310143 [Hyphomicrobiales bacterium]
MQISDASIRVGQESVVSHGSDLNGWQRPGFRRLPLRDGCRSLILGSSPLMRGVGSVIESDFVNIKSDTID